MNDSTYRPSSGKRLQDMMWRTHGSNFPTGHDRTKMVDFTHRTAGFQEGISMNTSNRIDSIWNTPFIITIIHPPFIKIS